MPVGKPFPKGVSANPGGRPKVLREFEGYAREMSLPMLKKLVVIALQGKGLTAVMAAKIVIERAWGKAPQPLVGKDGGPIDLRFRGAARAALEQALAEAEVGADGSDPTTPPVSH